MPYLSNDQKELLGDKIPVTPGELNYVITQILIQYVEHQRLSYGIVSEALSACTEAAAEFRRRVLVPLEDRKIEQNGDVYPDWLAG